MKISKYDKQALIFKIIIVVGFFLFVTHPTKESFFSKNFWLTFIILVPLFVFLVHITESRIWTGFLVRVIGGGSLVILLILAIFIPFRWRVIYFMSVPFFFLLISWLVYRFGSKRWVD